MPDYSSTPYKSRKARKLQPAGGKIKSGSIPKHLGSATAARKMGTLLGGQVKSLGGTKKNPSRKYFGRTR
jgi:hypothetical protein